MKIEHLIFDLDNTLYPSCGAMDKGITERMMNCVANFFNVSYEEAVKIREKNIKNFSTTLEWLRSEGLKDVESYFAAVHPENEADEVPENPELRPFLQSIKISKTILTNAPIEHAKRVLSKLNIQDLFDSICDIRETNLLGKPYSSAFDKALLMANATVDNALFLDDMRKYTDGFEALGGTSILIGNKNGHPLNKESAAVTKTKPLHPGRTLHLESIFQLPKMIQKLENQHQ